MHLLHFIYFYWYLKKYNISTNFSVAYLNIYMTITKQVNIKNKTQYLYNDFLNDFFIMTY